MVEIKELQSPNCKTHALVQPHITCYGAFFLDVIAKASLSIAGGLDSVFKEFEVLMIYTYTPFLYGEHIDTAYWDRQVNHPHVHVWVCGVPFICIYMYLTCQVTHL